MSAENTWGEKLKAFRQRAGVSQNRLVDEISHLLRDLELDEVAGLEKIGIFQDLEKLTIFDNPASLLNRYENVESRKPKNRKRHLSLLWGLQRLGGVKSVEEANTFLQLAESSDLTPKELVVIFGKEEPAQIVNSTSLDLRRHNSSYVTTRIDERIVSSVSKNSLVTNDLEKRVSVNVWSVFPKKTKIFLFTGGSMLVLITVFIAFTFIGANQVNDTSLIIADEFGALTLDSSQWNSSESSFVFVQEGELVFDLPLNSADTWEEETLHHNITDDSYYLAQIKFRARLDTSLEYESGYIGVQINCVDRQGFLTVYLGGTVRRIRAEYAVEDNVENGETVDLGELVTGKSYDVEIVWRSGGVFVYIDQELRNDRPIPCSSPLAPYFNISAGVGKNQKIKGAVDQISVWR